MVQFVRLHCCYMYDKVVPKARSTPQRKTFFFNPFLGWKSPGRFPQIIIPGRGGHTERQQSVGLKLNHAQSALLEFIRQANNIYYSKKQDVVKDENKETGYKLHPETDTGTSCRGGAPHLFDRQLLQLRQRAGQQPHQEGSGTANDIQHGAWQHGDERVLPGEGVEQRHHCVHAAGQGTEKSRRHTPSVPLTLSTAVTCRGHTRLQWT